jgi:hypothetical protein
MAFRALRQRRYDYLMARGFTSWESRVLSKIPYYVPYMAGLVKERAKAFAKYKGKGITPKEYDTHILKSYQAKGFKRGGKRSVSSVWQMVENYREHHRDQYTEYFKHGLLKKKNMMQWVGAYDDTKKKGFDNK